MRLLKIASLFLGIVLAAPHGIEAATLPTVGSEVQGSIKVGKYDVSLPEGSWTIVSAAEGKFSRLGVKDDETWAIPLHKVVLTQAKGNALSGIVTIETPITHEDHSFSSPQAFTQKSAFFAENFFIAGAARGKPSLVVVDPFVFSPVAVDKSVYAFINEKHLTTDKVFVRVGFNLAAYATFLKVDYFFAPTALGQSALSEEAAKYDMWHPERHGMLNPAEKSTLDGYVKWALDMQAKLITLF